MAGGDGALRCTGGADSDGRLGCALRSVKKEAAAQSDCRRLG